MPFPATLYSLLSKEHLGEGERISHRAFILWESHRHTIPEPTTWWLVIHWYIWKTRRGVGNLCICVCVCIVMVMPYPLPSYLFSSAYRIFTPLSSHHHHRTPALSASCKTQYPWHSDAPLPYPGLFQPPTHLLSQWIDDLISHTTGITATCPLGVWLISPCTMSSRFKTCYFAFQQDLQAHSRTRLKYIVTDMYYWHCPEDLDDSDKRGGISLIWLWALCQVLW